MQGMMVEDEAIECRRVLLDTPDILVVGNFCQNSDTIIFAFGDMLTRPDPDNAWGEAPSVKYGADVVSFVSRYRTWFPLATTLAAVDLVREVTKDRYATRITYGGSMGGYAAIRYSAGLHADRVVALVPQFTIDPDKVSDRRYNKYFDPELNTDMAVRADDVSGDVLLVSDPSYELDEQHIRLFQSVFPDALRMPLYNTEHNATALLANSRFFQNLVEFKGAQKDLWALIAQARVVMKVRPMYYRMLVRKIVQRRPSLIAPMLTAARAVPDAEKTLFERVIVDMHPSDGAS